jgi:hypothetical protein
MPSTSELLSSIHLLAINPLLRPHETEAQFVIAALNREIEFRLQRTTVPEIETQQSDDPKVLVCHYEVADPAGDRDCDEPIIVKFSWLDKRPDETLPVDGNRYTGLSAFAECYDKIMLDFGADGAVIVSAADISIVARNEEIQAANDITESNAWLILTAERIAAEGFGEVPEYAEVCRIFRQSKQAT